MVFERNLDPLTRSTFGVSIELLVQARVKLLTPARKVWVVAIDDASAIGSRATRRLYQGLAADKKNK